MSLDKRRFELWQGDKKHFTGTQQELAKFTKLSLGTIKAYCRPGYFDDKKNEVKNRIVEVTNE